MLYTVDDVATVLTEDMPEILSWWARREKAVPAADWFSSTGLWVPHVCAIWLYATDSGKAYVDETISNPDVKEGRSSAIIALGVALEHKAKQLGYRYLIGTTKHQSMAMRMEVSGWKPAGEYNIFVKDLEAI